MTIAYYIKKKRLQDDAGIVRVLDALRSGGADVVDVSQGGLSAGTDVLVSFGGDGTFLSASREAVGLGVPVLGVNLGRMGFLAGYSIDDIVGPLLSGDYSIERRAVLDISVYQGDAGPVRLSAVNEATVRRSGPGTLGVEVSLDGVPLPTYWADGVLLSTSSGSTAYSLSAGGPICMPDVSAFILAPIAPHNLNMRPLVVSSSSTVVFEPCGKVYAALCADNTEVRLQRGARVVVRASDSPLLKVALGRSNFIDALKGKLFWGEDVRNNRM